MARANIDESAALERNSDQQLANTLGVLNTDAQIVNTEITSLSEQIRNSDDPAEIARLVVDLQTAVMEKYRLQREVLQKRLDAEELTIRDFNAQLGSINLAETSELTSAAALGGAETDDLRRTSNALLQNAIQRAQFNLTGATSEQDFETRRQELLRFITEYYDAEKARIDALMLSESQLRDQQEDTEFARQRALQQATDATNRFAEDRIQTEMRLQDEISDLRDDAFDAEQDRADALVKLEQDTQDRITDTHRDALRMREDLNREFGRDFNDTFRESQEAIAELLASEGIGVGDARAFLQGFEGNIRSQLSDAGRARLSEIGNQRVDAQIDLERERGRDLEDIGIREDRGLADVEAGFTKSQQQIISEAEETAKAIALTLAPLLAEDMTAVLEFKTAETTTTTAALVSTTATTESETATTAAGTATTAATTAALAEITALTESENQDVFGTNIDALGMVAENLDLGNISTEIVEGLREAFDPILMSFESLPEQIATSISGALRSTINLLAASAQPRNNAFLPSTAQNTGGGIVSAETGGLAAQPPRNGGLAEQLAGGAGFEQLIQASLTIEYDDGSVSELGDQMLRLKTEDRSF